MTTTNINSVSDGMRIAQCPGCYERVPDKSPVRSFFHLYIPALARLWRKRGFPFYELDFAQKQKELGSLLEYDHARVISNGVVKQTMHGLSLAWSYFPHAWGVRCGDRRTPLEVFNEDALLQKAILKRVIWGDVLKVGRYPEKPPALGLTASSLRKGLRTLSGTQAVSNFRPTAAAAIYHKYLPEEGGVTWDMSMGWGGRLLGAVACPKVKKYIGCDPSKETFAALKVMEAEIKRLLPERELETDLYMLGSETLEMRAALPPNSVALAFSSPPYFDCERYSKEETQSYLKFPTADAWITDFIGQTLDNCAHCLKPDGILAINIADVSSYPNLTRDFVKYAEAHGWELVETLNLALSSMMGTRKKQTETHKYEPIYVFKKS